MMRQPRDLNPIHWLAIGQRLRYIVDDLDRAVAHLHALGSRRTTGQVVMLRDKCKDALSEAEKIAHRLGG